MSFEEYVKLASENAFAGDPGTKPISLEGAKALAMAHAEGDLPKKGEGFEVLETMTGNNGLGSVNEKGTVVGKRKPNMRKGRGGQRRKAN